MYKKCAFRCLVTLLLVTMPALAQFKAGIQGTIKDSSGAVVPGASVTVIAKETGRSYATISGDQGFYRVTGLPPGTYTVTAEMSGFKKAIIENITVNAEETRGVDMTLTPGGISETVTVTASAPALQTENANMSQAITTQEVINLPQVGRDPYELLRLVPGVFADGARNGSGLSVGLPNTTGPGGSNIAVFQVENQVPLSANGQRLSSNDFMIDGVSVNSLNWGGAAVVTPNQESVKEVRVVSSDYSAEDGRNSGAQIKVVSQNGTNSFHGSGVIKDDDPNFNAFNKWGGPNGAPPVRDQNNYKQFAASLGGPIIHDKLFFFGSYEGLRSSTTNYFTGYLETPQYRQLVESLRPGSNTAKVFASPGMDPRIAQVLPVNCGIFGNDPTRCRVVAGGLDIGSPTGATGQYVSLSNPTGGGFDGVPDLMFAQMFLPGQSQGDQYNGRVDYNPTQKDQIAVITYFTHRNDLNSDGASSGRPSSDLIFKPLNSAVTLLYNRTLSSTMLNEARFNVTRFASNQVADSSGTDFGIPRIQVESYPFSRIQFGPPWAETTPAVFAQNTYEFRDTFNKVFRTHGWKAGVEIRREQDNSNLLGGARPLYSFSGLWNLANSTPIFEQINADPRTGAPADAQRYLRTGDYAFFVQDDWKLRPNLTLNLGLRYEYYPPLSEKNGDLSNLIFGSQGLINSKVVVTNQLFQPDKNNFAPRVGFAWNPHAFDSNLVVRGGFGIAYNRIPGALFSNVRGNPPFFSRFGLCCGTASTDFGSPFANGQISYVLGANLSTFSYPPNLALAQGINPATGGPNVGAVEIWGAYPQEPNPYVYLWSLNLEYRLPANLVASAAYQASAGHKETRLVNQNFLFPGNPAFFQVFFPRPDVNSNYNAMVLRLTRQFAKGFQMQGVYTWSKSIDTLSYGGPGAVTNQTYPQVLASERGPSDFDVRHNFVMNSLWEVPFFNKRTDLLGRLLGGFQFSGILTAHSGYPWTPKSGQSVSTPGGPTLSPTRPIAYFGDAGTDTSNLAFMTPGLDFPGGGTKFFNFSQSGPPGVGRNSFRGPHYFDIDMSAAKRFALPGAMHLGEQANLELRANFFNVFNKLNLAPLGFFSAGTFVDNPLLGVSDGGLSGRVIEFQARFSF